MNNNYSLPLSKQLLRNSTGTTNIPVTRNKQTIERGTNETNKLIRFRDYNTSTLKVKPTDNILKSSKWNQQQSIREGEQLSNKNSINLLLL